MKKDTQARINSSKAILKILVEEKKTMKTGHDVQNFRIAHHKNVIKKLILEM
jgi:hypothetical protein